MKMDRPIRVDEYSVPLEKDLSNMKMEPLRRKFRATSADDDQRGSISNDIENLERKVVKFKDSIDS